MGTQRSEPTENLFQLLVPLVSPLFMKNRKSKNPIQKKSASSKSKLKTKSKVKSKPKLKSKPKTVRQQKPQRKPKQIPPTPSLLERGVLAASEVVKQVRSLRRKAAKRFSAFDNS